LKQESLLDKYKVHPKLIELNSFLSSDKKQLQIKGLIGSSVALTIACVFEEAGKQQHVIILPDKEQAAYF